MLGESTGESCANSDTSWPVEACHRFCSTYGLMRAFSNNTLKIWGSYTLLKPMYRTSPASTRASMTLHASSVAGNVDRGEWKR